jgi:hypothetical protein
VSVDDYARQVIQAGIDQGVTPRGIVIALATVYVESGWVMYANPADPESLNYPHEALSYDANSVGLFQQRAEWWGTCAQRMDPYQSAAMFYQRLKTFPYNDTGRSPGYWAQAVQDSAFPDRYDQHINEAQQLYDRLMAPKEDPVEKVLDYPRGRVGDYDGVLQQKPWDCAIAAAQVIAAAAGVYRSEDWILNRVNAGLPPQSRVDEDGTDTAELVCPVLDEMLPGSGYKAVWLSKWPVDQTDIEALWRNATRSIDARRGVLLNFEAPPGRGPKGTRGSVSPPYPQWSTTYHYTCATGYAVDPDSSRHFWVPDSAGFGGITGYWCALEDVARLIVPHAYAYAATAAIAAPAPAPTPAVVVNVDLSDKLARLQTEWDAIEFGDQTAIGVLARAAKTGDARAALAIDKLVAVNPTAAQQFRNAQKGAA